MLVDRSVASAPTLRHLLADLPGRHAELLGGDVADAGRPAGEDLGDRHDEHTVVGRHLHLEHRHLAVVAGAHDEVRERGRAGAPGDVDHDDRAGHGDPGGDVDHDGIDHEGVVQRDECVGLRRRPTRRGRRGRRPRRRCARPWRPATRRPRRTRPGRWRRPRSRPGRGRRRPGRGPPRAARRRRPAPRPGRSRRARGRRCGCSARSPRRSTAGRSPRSAATAAERRSRSHGAPSSAAESSGVKVLSVGVLSQPVRTCGRRGQGRSSLPAGPAGSQGPGLARRPGATRPGTTVEATGPCTRHARGVRHRY